MNQASKSKTNSELVTTNGADKALATTGNKSNTLEKLKADIGARLARVDASRSGKGMSYKSLWDEINQFVDINETIRLNLLQTEIHIQACEERYWNIKKRDEEKLAALMEKQEYDEYAVESECMLKKDAAHYKIITDLVKAKVLMAREYRQCALQEQFQIHITRVEQYKMSLLSALHENIHDQIILNAVATRMDEAGKAIGMVSNVIDVEGE